MKPIYKKIVINEASDFMRETYGFNYDVQIWMSADNKSFHYVGIGKYTKTIEEATDYINEYTKA